MPRPLSDSPAAAAAAPASLAGGGSPPLPAWLREPLLHFVVLGALLFGVDHVLGARLDDPRTIVVDATVAKEIRDTFQDGRGRQPDAQEFKALRQVWLDNEVLYREGLALQVDKGDQSIRDRVIFKALSVVDASMKLPAIDDAALRMWFEAHRAKYDEPARFDFQEAALDGEASEAAVRDFAKALNAGVPGDAKAGLRVFKGRPRGNIAQSYGEDFAQGLADATPGEWRALKSTDAWRAIRLDAVTPAKAATFENLRGVVSQDWVDATASEQRTAAVRALAKKYTVRDEVPRP